MAVQVLVTYTQLYSMVHSVFKISEAYRKGQAILAITHISLDKTLLHSDM